MDCPVCKVELKISERQGIEIDYCPKCRGIWLDRGEIDKIIERSAAEANPDRGHAGDRHRHEYHEHKHYEHKKHRRKSFLEELFD